MHLINNGNYRISYIIFNLYRILFNLYDLHYILKSIFICLQKLLKLYEMTQNEIQYLFIVFKISFQKFSSIQKFTLFFQNFFLKSFFFICSSYIKNGSWRIFKQNEISTKGPFRIVWSWITPSCKYNELINLLTKIKISKKKDEFKSFLFLLMNIYYHHYHQPNIFNQIKKLIIFL